MQWIFLTLVIGYATAQQYQSAYQLQQEQKYLAQPNIEQTNQQAGQQTPQMQQHQQQLSLQQHNSGQWLSPNVLTNYRDEQYQQYTSSMSMPGTLLSINYGSTPQQSLIGLALPASTPKQVPPPRKQGQPLEQARPLTSTEASYSPAMPTDVTPSSPGVHYDASSQSQLQLPTPPRKQGQPLLQARPRPTAARPLQRTTTPAGAADDFRNRFSSPVAAAAVHNNFNADLFNVIVSSLPQRNIVYSPISLQLLLAFVYTGASGQTALQLQRALSLPATVQDTEKIFYNLLQTHLNSGSTELVMANKIYHSLQLTLQPEMLQRARYFESAIEASDFSSPRAAAAAINDWVAQKTQNIIPQLVAPEQLNAQTQAMLVSAIHFKAKWAKEFSTGDTEQQDFYASTERAVPVNMMYNDDTYRYGEFPELDATGLEMMYENSNMSMLILLPRKVNGLAAMEQRLQGVDLNRLTARMTMESVTVRIPRFRVEFELNMLAPLRRLGITDLFTDRAELKGFFRSQSVGVSQVQHKAFLDVNEAGSEAAAASFIKLIPLSLPNRLVQFTADHPFMFAIRSPQAVFFIGHVVDVQ